MKDNDENLQQFMTSIDEKIATLLVEMAKTEDWTVSKKDPEYLSLIDYIAKLLSNPDIPKKSFLATQLLGWVSAPQCLMLVKELSQVYPSLIKSIFLEETNNDITRMVVERLYFLEKHSYLKQMLDPGAIRSISRGIRHYYKHDVISTM